MGLLKLTAMDKPKNYSIEEKMAGKDLHGLPSRVPKPTAEQSRCTHSRIEWKDEGWQDSDGQWHSEMRSYDVSTCEDIPGTNNFRCTRCGYTRRY